MSDPRGRDNPIWRMEAALRACRAALAGPPPPSAAIERLALYVFCPEALTLRERGDVARLLADDETYRACETALIALRDGEDLAAEQAPHLDAERVQALMQQVRQRYGAQPSGTAKALRGAVDAAFRLVGDAAQCLFPQLPQTAAALVRGADDTPQPAWSQHELEQLTLGLGVEAAGGGRFVLNIAVETRGARALDDCICRVYDQDGRLRQQALVRDGYARTGSLPVGVYKAVLIQDETPLCAATFAVQTANADG